MINIADLYSRNISEQQGTGTKNDVRDPYAVYSNTQAEAEHRIKGADRVGDKFTVGSTDDVRNTSEMYDNNGRISDEEKKAQEAQNDEDSPEEVEKELDRIASTMTEDDYKTLYDEGFPIDKMTPAELEVAIERIKFQREMRAEGIEKQIEKLGEQEEYAVKVVLNKFKGDPRAEQIAKMLSSKNVPVTVQNIENVLGAMKIVDELMPDGKLKVTEDMAQYLVTGRKNATLENIYYAKSMAGVGAKREKELTDATWKQLEPSVTKLLFNAGIKNDRSMIDTAKTFIKKDIPLTTDNMIYYRELKKISLTKDEVLEKAVDAAATGKNAKDALLSTMTSAGVKGVISRLSGVSNEAVDAAVETAVNEGEEAPELSLGDLFDAQEVLQNGKETIYTHKEKDDIKKQSTIQAASLKTRRQLEEIRSKLTFESGYRLAKQGFRLDAERMTGLVDALKELEDGIYTSFLKQAGMNVSPVMLERLRMTTETVNELKDMPALIIADTAAQGGNATLEELHDAGVLANAKIEDPTFRKFRENYESVMTTPRGDMGDSLKKAFGNIDGLITSAGLEVTDQSERAVRILAYNGMEVNKENIERIEAHDAQVQRVLSGLHPAVTVRMLRDGISPLSETLDDLEAKIAQIKEEEGITSDEKFSNFLVNLDKQNGLTDKERKAYIGIYRALNQIEKSEGAAVGSVVRTGHTMTLTNLQKAVKNGKVHGFDVSVDDKFGASLLAQTTSDKEAIAREVDRKSKALGQNAEDVLKKSAGTSDINNEEDLEAIPAERVESEVKEIRQLAEEVKNPSRFLDDYKVIPTVENLKAAQELLSDDMTVFKELKRIYGERDEEDKFTDLIESLDSKETMQKAVEDFTGKALELKKQMYQNPETGEVDLAALKSIDVSVRFMRRLSKREFYQIPLDTGDDITNVNVTIVKAKDAQEKGKVVVEIPTLNFGKVSAEATVRDHKVKCFITSDTKDGTQSLRDRQLNLFATLAGLGVESEAIYYGTELATGDYKYKTDGVYQEQGSEESAQADSNELYKVAKAILLHVKDADRQ